MHIHCRHYRLANRQNTPTHNPTAEKATFRTLYIFLFKVGGYYMHCFITQRFRLRSLDINIFPTVVGSPLYGYVMLVLTHLLLQC
jgi:hypothetical protein